MTKYEDVKDIRTEDYFEGNQFSIEAFNKKYALYEQETYVQALKRVCDFIASVEITPSLQTYWSERWFDEIYNDWWHPAGSIMQGAGSGRKISLANCTHISMGGNHLEEEWDSLEGINNAKKAVYKSAAYRQGLGVDFSRLRPKGTKVLNSANESTGITHWMKSFDQIGYEVGQKGRIPAMLFSLNVSHPDIEEFITIKSNSNILQNANISVQCTNKFYKAVEENKDWKLTFEIPEVKIGNKIYIDVHSIDLDTKSEIDLDGNIKYYNIAQHSRPAEKIEKTVKAKTILEMIAKGMFLYAEPGIQNIDIARKYSNSDYVYDKNDIYDSRIIGTNACSEQYLSRDSLCVLASINVGKFSTEIAEYEKELGIIGPSINRFLDNVNECELVYKTYATPFQGLSIKKLRRTGAGSTNWEAWLFKQNLNYGEPAANQAARLFNKKYNYELYNSSIQLGKEKGNFGLFNQTKYEQSPFIKYMMKQGLKFTNMRNVTCSSIAPTGTLSLMFRGLIMSYGVEPGFGLYYWKRTRMSGVYEYYFNVPNIIRERFKKSGYPLPMNTDTIKDTWDGKYGKVIVNFMQQNMQQAGINYTDATHISPLNKLEFMEQLMKDCDSSISVTYMLPEISNWENIYEFILQAYKKEVKSIAAYPYKKLYGIVSYIPFKDLATTLISEGIKIHPQNFSDDEQKELNICDSKIIEIRNAPKRPKILPADIYSIIVSGQKFVVAVGLLNNKPYEIFCGNMNGLNFKFKERKGKIEKIKRGHYKLEIGDDVEVDNFSEHFKEVEKTLFRMVSTSLRHGIPIKFIVDQLQKSSTNLASLTAAAGRVLKKYIQDGEKVTGQSCPNCGSTNLIYAEGCVTCSSCGWSKCE